MKITEVQYALLKNTGNFENARYGAVGTVEEGETPDEAMAKLRQFVERQVALGGQAVMNAQAVLACPDAHTGYEVKQAKELLARLGIEARPEEALPS